VLFRSPSWVICIDGEPLEEDDGSITLYQGDEEDLKERFMSIVYLSDDSSRVTIRKYDLVPYTFESSISSKDFKKKARETKGQG
jgi:hypothetical protein